MKGRVRSYYCFLLDMGLWAKSSINKYWNIPMQADKKLEIKNRKGGTEESVGLACLPL